MTSSSPPRLSPNRLWAKSLWSLTGSVIPAIWPRVLICVLFALGVTILNLWVVKIFIPLQDSLVPGVVLGLLLVFRTNTAYERFWEGRKVWGNLINTVRNLARAIWVAVEEMEQSDRQQKIETLRLLIAFAIATKLYLRSQKPNAELAGYLSPERFQKLKTMNNPPLEIAFWIGNYLQAQYEKGYIHPYQLAAMIKLLDTMVEVLGSCERILKTPIPLAYAIHLRQLIFLYCFTTPFQMVNSLQWATPWVVGVIAFTVFGIEEIGVEIENPFGHDAKDLPLEQICRTMQINIEDLISLAPCVQKWRQYGEKNFIEEM